MMPEDPEEPEIDDVPFADPAIRMEYEAALGQFILAYNEVDYRVSQVIRAELSHRGREDLAASAAKGFLSQRLATLELLATNSKSGTQLATSVAKLRSLNADRNNLAHGHFDQNPFDGSYTVLATQRRNYPVARIRDLTAELAEIAEQLRAAEILYDFLHPMGRDK